MKKKSKQTKGNDRDLSRLTEPKPISPELKRLFDDYERDRALRAQTKGTFDKEIASLVGRALAKDVSGPEILKAALEHDAARTKPVGRASVEYTVAWVFQKHQEKRAEADRG